MGEVALQRCTKCGEVYPLTGGWWYQNKTKRLGYEKRCKTCMRSYNNTYYKSNRQSRLEYARQYRENNAEQRQQYACQYHKHNTDKRLEYARQYRKDNAEQRRQYSRQYRYANKNSLAAYQRRWRKANADKVRIIDNRYEARRRALPDTYTPDDWQYALDYFNGCCAVCGRQLNDLFGEHTAAMDHWIPLSSDDCPGTVPRNIVPLCHGVGSCNNSKHNKNAELWLVETFGRRKANAILARIQAYFDSLP